MPVLAENRVEIPMDATFATQFRLAELINQKMVAQAEKDGNDPSIVPMIVAYRTNTDRPKAHLVLDGRIDRPRFAVRTAVMRCGMKIADKDIKIALKDPTGQVNDAPDYQE